MGEKYFDIEKDGIAGVTVSVERYRELLNLETRVAVIIEAIESEDSYPYYSRADIAKLLGANIKEDKKDETV